MSNPVGKQSSTNINSMNEQGGRVVREDNTVINWANELMLERYGSSLINGKPQGTVFGVDMVVGMEKTAISGKGDLGLNLSGIIREITTTGRLSITPNETTIEVSGGTSPTGSMKAYTLQRVRYEAGKPLFKKFTIAFPDPAETNGDRTDMIGFLSARNGFLLTQKIRSGVPSYYFTLYRDAVRTDYPLDNPELVDNWYNLNIMYLRAGYLGVAPTEIYLSGEDVNGDTLFYKLHKQRYDQKMTSVKTPNLSVGAWSINEGNTLDVPLLCGSYEAGTVNGGQSDDPNVVIRTYERTYSAVSATDQLIFAFKSPLTTTKPSSVSSAGIVTRVFNNTIDSELLEVNFSADGSNKDTDVDLYIMPEADFTGGSFTPIDMIASVIEVSTIGSFVLTNAIKFEKFTVLKDSGTGTLVIKEKDLLFPGYVAVFVRTSASATHDFSGYIKYQDRY